MSTVVIKRRNSLAMFLVLVVIVLLGGFDQVAGAKKGPTPAQCKEERKVAINACKPVLYGKVPTRECCERMRVTHLKCVCPVITPKLAALIDVNRFVKIVEGCGRKLPHHFKCGSITIP